MSHRRRSPVNNETWMEFEREVSEKHPAGFTYSVCGLCGNFGKFSVRGLLSPAGVPVAPIANAYCICPNGRVMKWQNDQATKKAKALDAAQKT